MTTATKVVRMNGTPVRVPAGELTDPHPHIPQDTPCCCGAAEPDWPDGQGGAFCTIAVHGTGPDGTAHIAHNGSRDVIAIWWDAPAVPSLEDLDD